MEKEDVKVEGEGEKSPAASTGSGSKVRYSAVILFG